VRLALLIIVYAVLAAASGCVAVVPAADYNSLQTQNRALFEQNKALLAEAENRNIRGREMDDRLASSEKQLASMQERLDAEHRQLDNYRLERKELYSQFNDAVAGRGRIPDNLARQLTELSRRCPNLQFDAETGIGKLDMDVLFAPGDAVMRADAATTLDDLVRVLKSPAAENTKIMIAGHTDDQPAGRSPQGRHADSFQLSTNRALAVADYMKQSGLPEHRIAVAGFGAYQPIASNVGEKDRRKNRRVEIFVLAPGTPVVGWTESTPTVYSAGRSREQR
jgi:outer membrane protein OmpA-like peptidoglycan-associated protein